MKLSFILMLLLTACSPVTITGLRQDPEIRINMYMLIAEYKQYEKACMENKPRYTHMYYTRKNELVTVESYDSIPPEIGRVLYMGTFFHTGEDSLCMDGFMKHLECVYFGD